MYVNDEKKLIFLAHPRTASRAVARALNLWCGFREVGPHHSGFDATDYPGYQCFTTVRNHWDAITSWFFNAVGQADDPQLTVHWLKRWMQGNRNYFRLPRLWWFLGYEPRPRILRYETLIEDYHNFLGEQGLGPTRLPLVGWGAFRKGKPYRDVMPSDVRDFIQETFAEEIDELGYHF